MAVRKILEDANSNAGFQKVIAAFNGHDHTDYVKEVNGIYYVHINSMSYKWVGDKYQYEERFPDEVNQRRPNLKKTVPYKDPLFAKVSIGKGVIKVEGSQSSFIEPGPAELGIDLSQRSTPFVAQISDLSLDY